MRVKHIKEPKESNDVYIGRGSIWGNPYKIGVHGDRDRVIRLYERHIFDSPELLDKLPGLVDKNLVCYCAPKKCHGDILQHLVEKAVYL